jgi:integrase
MDHGTRRYEGGFDTEDNARQALDVRIGVLMTGKIGKDVESKRQTLSGLIEAFFASRADHRSVGDDRSRWKLHLEPEVGDLHLQDVTESRVSRLVTGMTVAPATKQRVIHLLSAFYRWAIREKHIKTNPVREYFASASKKDRSRLRSTHDHKKTPFLAKEFVAHVFRALPEPVNVAFALSALAGLRPGEVLALDWSSVNFIAQTISVVRQVRQGKLGPPKNDKPRDVPMVPGLAAILKARRKETGLVVPPTTYTKTGRPRGRFLSWRTIDAALTQAFSDLSLPDLTFYNAGRHSFASNWVISGQSVYELSQVLGHSSVVVTERYAHLGQKTSAEVLAAVDVDLSVVVSPASASAKAN